MSAQLRYHTLVNNIGRIYSSEEKERTQYLQKGLDEIVGAIRPTTSDDWKRVKTDSDRLLKIWNVKENTDAASSVVVDQIRDMLLELSSAASSVISPTSSVPPLSYPALKQQIHQSHQNHQNHPTLEVSDKIAHVQDRIPLLSSFVKFVSATPTVESKVAEAEEEQTRVVVLSVSESKEGKEEEVEEVEEEEVEEVEEEEEEVEEEEVEEEEEEVEEEDEVVEPEEDEEEAEEEGLEVEQITIRGRTYWLDVNTKKLYANLEGDDVGDEVGAMVNGKAVFLAK